MSRRRLIVANNEGRRRLLEEQSRGLRQKAIADQIGHSQTEVSLWSSGKRVPDYYGRVALMRSYGIALDAWDREVNAADRAVGSSNIDHAIDAAGDLVGRRRLA